MILDVYLGMLHCGLGVGLEGLSYNGVMLPRCICCCVGVKLIVHRSLFTMGYHFQMSSDISEMNEMSFRSCIRNQIFA